MPTPILICIVLHYSAVLREIDAVKLIRKAIRDQKTMFVDVVVNKEHDFRERKNTPKWIYNLPNTF